jgi:hypothetical protein
MIDPHCHTSSILVSVTPAAAFEIMSDGIKQGAWAWGSFDRREVEPGLFVGTSVFDGKQTYVRLKPDVDRLLVDYEVGRSPDQMQFRNMARIIPGELLGQTAGTAVITLMTWRLAKQTEADWQQFSTIHEAEMFLIKGLLERK